MECVLEASYAEADVQFLGILGATLTTGVVWDVGTPPHDDDVVRWVSWYYASGASIYSTYQDDF